jgi:hypothetical protein
MRPAIFFAAVWSCVGAGWLQAQTEVPTVAASAPVLSSTAPAAPGPAVSSGWLHTETLRGSVGWRDNALLSPFAPIGRAFARAELETFFLREQGDWKFLSLINGDVLRYFSPPPETGGEQQWFVHGEMRWQHWPAGRLALKADGFLQDAVIDLSETESIRTVAPTRAQGVFVTSVPRLELPGGFALEPLVQVKRVAYREIPGDYDETKAGARLEWKHSDALMLSATWYEHRRNYSERPRYTAGGRALKGTHLDFWQREGELKASTAWSGGGQWTAAVTAGRLENRDRASGFFDYDQNRGRMELAWQGAQWKISFDGEAKRMNYLVQTVGAGTAPPPRVADDFETTLRFERKLTDGWTLFAEHRWERNRSNENEFSYRANTVLVGIQRDY